MSYLYLPFLLQTILMGLDEHIHSKRDLGLWERFGHPLDTLTVFVPISFVAVKDFTDERLTVYVILSVFSCLFITKDEFVHTKVCSGIENWIHSLLFVLHPMIFLCSGLIWKYHPEDEFLTYQAILVGIFMIYQILRWSIRWKQLVR